MLFLNTNQSRIIFVGLVFAFSFLMMLGFQLNHDTSWYLISTRWWIDGIPIYEEISELNPPLAFYLYAPPVFVAKILNVDPTLIARLYVFLIAGASITWGHFLMQRDGRLTQSQLTIMTTSVSIGFVVVSFGSFAQREHLMLLFSWPYVVSLFVGDSVTSAKQKICIGIYAFLGLGLKPIFLLIPVLMSLARFAQSRKLASIFLLQNVMLLLAGGVYVVLSYILHPAYFSDIIPKTMMVYGAYKSELSTVFARSRTPFVLFVMILAASYFSPKTRLSQYVYGMAAAVFAAFLFFNIQSKGWAYQMLPFRVYLWLFATISVISLYSEAKQKISGIAFGLLIVLILLVPSLIRGPYSTLFIDGLATHFQCKPGNRTYQVFGANVSTGYPMANKAGALPAVRTPTLWLFPGIIHRLTQNIDTQERDKLNHALDTYTESIIDDLLRVKPQVLFFDDRPLKQYFHEAPFDYIQHFLKYPRFVNIMTDYEYIDLFSEFKIYRRQGC
jgi:hypothetical protein